MKPGALTTWFWRLYDNVGLNGCSSHSGRRTFGTEMARRCNHFHASLYDVQKMLGHARLETTQAYIAPSQDTYNMVASLGYADFRPEAVQSADDVRPRRRNASSAPRAAKAKSYRANAWRYRT
jgi:hypothetical protein